MKEPTLEEKRIALKVTEYFEQVVVGNCLADLMGAKSYENFVVIQQRMKAFTYLKGILNEQVNSVDSSQDV